jgi:hypothetical protein
LQTFEVTIWRYAMGFSNHKADGTVTKDKADSKARILFANVGDGAGIFKGTNGSIVELRGIEAVGGLELSIKDERTLVITGESLQQELAHARTEVQARATAMQGTDARLTRQVAILGARISHLETSQFTLTKGLKQLDQMPKFNGCVPVIQNGEWASLNLAVEFFNRYEEKILKQNIQIAGLKAAHVKVEATTSRYNNQLNSVCDEAARGRFQTNFWVVFFALWATSLTFWIALK